MAITINEFDKYRISGKIIKINNDIFTISVTSPFTCEIEFHCSSEHYDLLHPPVSPKYNWISWVQDLGHPSVSEASAYYNTEDKCFYAKESGRNSEWKPIDFEDLYDDDNPSLFTENRNIQQHREKYWFFQDRYMSILQKEQLCEFSAYALYKINRDWTSIQSKQVKRHPDDYFWIYDPDSFYAKKWGAESIDNLVKEIRPSRDCLKQLLQSCEDDDGAAKKEKRNRKWKRIKSTPKRLQNWLAEYDKLMIGLGGLIVGVITASVAILTFLKR